MITKLPRLKELRKSLKLSQAQFAEKLNMPQQQYSRYEIGKNELPIEYIKRVCLTYNVTADWLLEIDNRREE